MRTEQGATDEAILDDLSSTLHVFVPTMLQPEVLPVADLLEGRR